MMPWTHAIVAYIAYSVSSHALARAAPTTRETALVAFGALLPDLVDKPLAWQFGLLQGGRTLAHSIFVAVPVSVAVVAVSARRGRPRLGLAFAAGYLLHLPGDILPAFLASGELAVGTLLWPVTDGGGSQGESFLGEFMTNFVPYVRGIARAVLSGDLSAPLLAFFAFWVLAVALWVYDGMPVVRDGYRWVRRTVARRN
ncbi:metal-dependent hydrolase [Haloarcula onubensis]|uniref:Metal-dependent hydrolase n=1 Tax=Haloarcula onubensis TaxID=2950539 RepID=A0ABU2FUX2_9EURY|nr:metal-dependent hydrolase [Halomicroarcula sp. S3CR25-11]MDS0284562.1 metal-dependent hydrolase [Halomicroarcula sp. S3CR25-11]